MQHTQQLVSVLRYQDDLPVLSGSVVPLRGRSGQVNLAVVLIACPYCGQIHQHGAGREVPAIGADLGTRLPHCARRPWDCPEYRITAGMILPPRWE